MCARSYESLAGLAMARGTRGWQRLQFAPQVWAPNADPPASICPSLNYVDASIVTPRGRAAAAWQCPSGSTCGTAAENSNLTLSCPPGHVVDSIVFASFGTATGNCTDGFSASSCNAPASTSVMQAACVGKQQCSVAATNGVFGGDPCINVVKHLSAQAACKRQPTPGSVEVFAYDVTVPAGSTASVILPTMGGDVTAKGVAVTEGGAAIWQNGAFVSGVPGVAGAGPADPSMGGKAALAVEIGSGDYSFVVMA